MDAAATYLVHHRVPYTLASRSNCRSRRLQGSIGNRIRVPRSRIHGGGRRRGGGEFGVSCAIVAGSSGVGITTRLGEMSQEIKRVRAQMEENEDLAILMRGLRGQNLTDSQFAADNVQLRLVENKVARAIELREIVTSLEPAYIKLGQALSIRPDILSPVAVTELQNLLDKVNMLFYTSSFCTDLFLGNYDVAMALIEEELGQPWHEMYSELSPSPISAASLGQVYKGRLKENGDLVAVKVQRPFVHETGKISIDLVGLVDEWAACFFEELDYVNEGENGMMFAEMMRKDLPQYQVPTVNTLTTQWIEGEKLSQITASDVGELVNVGVICYLKQLLDTGFFHADPHPGNLIRPPEGKLAILDFGLVTKLTDDQKYGMIEAIAHLIHRDYDAIVKRLCEA
ncbi:hypothetical protein AKJ16_DCAP24499 [Drosera capensis]